MTTKTIKIYFVFNNRFQRVMSQESQYFIGSDLPNTLKTLFQVSSVGWELTKDKIGVIRSQAFMRCCPLVHPEPHRVHIQPAVTVFPACLSALQCSLHVRV